MTDSTKGTTRRQFVKTAAAAAVAPLVVHSSILGLEGRAAPSERITMGFIGIGVMNWGHLKFHLEQPDTQVLAVCDCDTDRREHGRIEVDKKYRNKNCKDYNDFRELCARKDIDSVCIATPDQWHVLPIIEAVRNGKDVYCEKPLTHTLAEAELVIKAVRKYKRVMQTGSQQRSENEGRFRKACELVRNGYIGQVLTIHIGVGNPPVKCTLGEEPMQKGLDWDMWVGPAQMRPYHSELSPRGVHNHFPNWRNYEEFAGGYLADWGAHHFDIAQWGIGMDGSGPVEIFPPEEQGAKRGVNFRYKNGVRMYHGGPGGVQFTGTQGMIYVDRSRLISNPDGVVKKEIKPDQIHLYDSGGSHKRNWIDCMKSRKDPICPVEVGAGTVAICHLANIAYKHHIALKWDPEKWRFTEPQSANQWLDKERRDPWQLPQI